METQLQELIEKIKSEGVKSAEEQSNQIVQEAEKRADNIVKEAQQKAEKIIADARQQTEKMEQTGKETLKQAGRDLLLTLQQKITALFDAVIKDETAKSLDEKAIQDVIISMLEKWSKEETENLSVLLSEEEFDKLSSHLRAKLSEELKKGVEIKPFSGVKTGFYIAEKDGSAYYNFSDQGIADNLAELLNPKLKEILQEAVSEES
jgi:V/A-type H+-transporting ATPase subunit E